MASATPKSADDALWISEAVGFVAGASLKQLKLLEGAIASRRDELESGVATAEGEVTAGADSEDPAAEIVAEAIATGNFNKLDIVKLARQPVTAADVAGKSEIRLLLNGCFDIMHAGHYNALRQAKGLFAGFRVPVLLVAGIHRTESIIEQKGPPVMTMEERIAMVEACKWVDEVAVIPEYLINNAVLDLLNCDFCAHGDDIPIRTDGTGMYHEVIAANRFRMIKRTEGVSTTTFIGRLLQAVGPTAGVVASDADEGAAPVAVSATLLPTGSRITTFADGMRPIGEAKRVVYVDGTFDCLHVGHIEFLKRARAQGDYLLVGLHSDAVATATHGPGNPIMALHERALCLLACKWVDDIILGAPWVLTKDLLTTMNIAVVVAGTESTTRKRLQQEGEVDPYAAAKELRLFEAIESGSTVTTQAIRQRIVDNYQQFTARNKIKDAADETYYKNKVYFKEQNGRQN